MKTRDKIIAVLIVLVSLYFGLTRIMVPQPGVDLKHTFKDMAHLWCGVLIGISFFRVRYWMVTVSLIIVEVIMFLVTRH